MIERAPGSFQFYSIGVLEGDRNRLIISDNVNDPSALGFVAAYLDSMRSSALGTERVVERVRTKAGDVKIKNIIHVRPKSERDSGVGVYGAPLDWSHRWEVMGHWRRIDGIGKNRQGQHEVVGYTWVVPHEKGAKNAPLVKKTRVATHKKAG